MAESVMTYETYQMPFKNPQDATWDCPTCGTIQPIRREQSQGRAVFYYKQMCDCVWRTLQARALARKQKEQLEKRIDSTFGGLAPGSLVYPFRKHTFASFDANRQPEAFEAAQLFALDLKGCLVLYGPYGTGKTHLLAAICNALIDRGIGCYFIKAPDLFAAMKELMDTHQSYQPIIDRAINVPVLVLDDVDKASPSAWRQECYYSIIDWRTTYERPIAISTNQLGDLDYFVGGACADRLTIGQIAVSVGGPSFRKEL